MVRIDTASSQAGSMTVDRTYNGRQSLSEDTGVKTSIFVLRGRECAPLDGHAAGLVMSRTLFVTDSPHTLSQHMDPIRISYRLCVACAVDGILMGRLNDAVGPPPHRLKRECVNN